MSKRGRLLYEIPQDGQDKRVVVVSFRTCRHDPPGFGPSAASASRSERWVGGIARDGDRDLVNARPGRHIESLAAGAAEGQVSDIVFRDRHPAQELALGAEHVNALGDV